MFVNGWWMSLVFCDSVETPLFVAAAAGNPWRKFSPLATTECTKSSPGGNFRSASLRCALPENLSTALNSAFFLPLTFCVTKLQITAPHRALSSGHQPWGPQSDDGGGFRHGFHHTHTHTRSLANFCAGSTQFFPFLCCFCCLLLQGTTFFFASSATFFLFLATLTGYDRRPLLLHCLPLFHGRVLPSCWSTTTTSEHSRVWANFRCHKLCFFFYLHNWPTSSSAC